jgi:hypothetical protein
MGFRFRVKGSGCTIPWQNVRALHGIYRQHPSRKCFPTSVVRVVRCAATRP